MKELATLAFPKLAGLVLKQCRTEYILKMAFKCNYRVESYKSKHKSSTILVWLSNFYSRFICNYVVIARPIKEYLRKGHLNTGRSIIGTQYLKGISSNRVGYRPSIFIKNLEVFTCACMYARGANLEPNWHSVPYVYFRQTSWLGNKLRHRKTIASYLNGGFARVGCIVQGHKFYFQTWSWVHSESTVK